MLQETLQKQRYPWNSALFQDSTSPFQHQWDCKRKIPASSRLAHGCWGSNGERTVFGILSNGR